MLNAKQHEREAFIVAQAGKFGAVTIATNMAGRGTDIKLGGNVDFMAQQELMRQGLDEKIIAEAMGFAETDNEEILSARAEYKRLVESYSAEVKENGDRVRAAGGLFILGTERHESRRVDNQLRGRSGRQGDPGESRFIISMEDDLLRLFGSDRIQTMMESLGLDEDTPIDQKMLTGAIENAQKRVEGRNFEARKHVLEYDNVMNVQRGVIYKQRGQVLDGEDIQPVIRKMYEEIIEEAVTAAYGDQATLDTSGISHIVEELRFVLPEEMLEAESMMGVEKDTLIERFHEGAAARYAAKEEEITPALMREAERVFLLRNVDRKWMDHIDAMQELRQGIGLRAYAQHDPVIEYKREGFEMFEAMIAEIRRDTVRSLFSVRLRNQEEPKREQVAKVTMDNRGDGSVKPQPKKSDKKPGRNDPCPCGSGKKYKKCCGMNE